jgi:hypothetical protein
MLDHPEQQQDKHDEQEGAEGHARGSIHAAANEGCATEAEQDHDDEQNQEHGVYLLGECTRVEAGWGMFPA